MVPIHFEGIIDKIYNCDFLNMIDEIPNESFDLIILDPPYNISVGFGGVFTFSKMSDGGYENYIMSWLPQVVTKLKPTGTLYMCGDWACSYIMYKCLESCGLYVKNRITWARDKGRGASKNWKNCMEDIWFATKNKNNYTFNLEDVKIKKNVIATYHDEKGNNKDWQLDDEGNPYRMTCPPNIWTDMVVPFWSMPENTEHKTQKPEKLIERLILASSNPGDCIFDPFLGSGTTAVVANRLGRHYCGIEINKRYVAISMKRLRSSSDE